MTTTTDNPAPDQCKVVLDELFQAIAWLHRYWRYYASLFGTSPDRFDVYNKRTGTIFWVLERTLRHEIIHELAKLLGNHESRGHKVVSIRRAIVDLPFERDDDRKVRLLKELVEVQKKHRAIRELRDGALAHNDLAVVMKSRQIDGVSRAMIREAVQDTVHLTNQVLLVYIDSGYGFPDHGDEERDVKNLLKILELGNAELDRHHLERKARWQAKHNTTIELPEYPPDDEG